MAQGAPGRHFRERISLIEAVEMFPDDGAAEARFVRTRWPDGRYCPALRIREPPVGREARDHAVPVPREGVPQADRRSRRDRHAVFQSMMSHDGCIPSGGSTVRSRAGRPVATVDKQPVLLGMSRMISDRPDVKPRNLTDVIPSRL